MSLRQAVTPFLVHSTGAVAWLAPAAWLALSFVVVLPAAEFGAESGL